MNGLFEATVVALEGESDRSDYWLDPNVATQFDTAAIIFAFDDDIRMIADEMVAQYAGFNGSVPIQSFADVFGPAIEMCPDTEFDTVSVRTDNE